MNIIRLDSAITEQLRSAYSINSISHCIIELVLNALDANPINIAVRVNLVSFRIEVSDDGTGIAEENLKNVGKRHYTNKFHSLEDMDRVRDIFGYRGESLASIASNCRMLKITTRFRNSNDNVTVSSGRKTFRKTIAGNEVTTTEHSIRPSFGTTVTIIDFMNRFPVRRKCANSIEFSKIKSFLAEIHFLHPKVAFKLIDSSTKQTIFETFHKDSPKEVLVDSLSNVTMDEIKFYKIRCSTNISIKGLLVNKLTENSKYQLLFVNKRPIVSNQLRDYINEMLIRHKFCLSKKAKRHPNYAYIFNVSCPLSQFTIVNKNEVEFKTIKPIMKALAYLLMKFIKHEGVHLQTVTKKKVDIVKRTLSLSRFRGAYKAAASRNINQLIDYSSSHDNGFEININYKKDDIPNTRNILAMDTTSSVTSDSEEVFTAGVKESTRDNDSSLIRAIKDSNSIKLKTKNQCVDGKIYIMYKYLRGQYGCHNARKAHVFNELKSSNFSSVDDNFDSLVSVLGTNHKDDCILMEIFTKRQNMKQMKYGNETFANYKLIPKPYMNDFTLRYCKRN